MKFKMKYVIPILLIFITSIALTFTGTYMSLFLKNKLLFNNQQIGFYYSISSIANIIISMILAYISDQNHSFRRWVIYIGLLAAGAGYYLFAFSVTYTGLLINSITLIALSSCITPQLFALIHEILKADSIEENRISQVITFLRSLISAAYVVGPLLAAIILDENHFERLYLYASFIYIISFMMVILFYRKIKIDSVQKKKMNSVPTNLNNLIFMFLMFVMIQIVHSTISTFFSIYLTEVKSIAYKDIGLISSYSALVEIPLLILWGSFLQKISLKKLLYLGLLSGIVFLIIEYIGTMKFILIGSYLFNAIFYTTTVGLGMALFQKMIPSKQGLATSIFMNTSSLGKIASGFLLSMINNQYSLIIQFCIVLLIISLFILKKIEFINNNKQ